MDNNSSSSHPQDTKPNNRQTHKHNQKQVYAYPYNRHDLAASGDDEGQEKGHTGPYCEDVSPTLELMDNPACYPVTSGGDRPSAGENRIFKETDPCKQNCVESFISPDHKLPCTKIRTSSRKSKGIREDDAKKIGFEKEEHKRQHGNIEDIAC